VFADLIQFFNELGNDHLVIKARLVCGPASYSHRNGKHAERRAIGAFEIGRPVELHLHPWVVAGNSVHAEVHDDYVWVVVTAPDVTLALVSGIAAVAILLPVRDTVDAVAIRLFRRALQTAPDKVLDIVVQRFYFVRVGKFSILAGKVGWLTQARIIAGYFIYAPSLDAVVVIRPQLDLGVHIPFRKQTVVPLIRIADPMLRDKGGAFVDECLQRLGGKELQSRAAASTVVYGEQVLAQPGKFHTVKAASLPLAE